MGSNAVSMISAALQRALRLACDIIFDFLWGPVWVELFGKNLDERILHIQKRLFVPIDKLEMVLTPLRMHRSKTGQAIGVDAMCGVGLP